MSSDSVVIQIQWLAIGHQPSMRWDQPSTQRYFVATPQPGFFRRLGVPATYSVVPHALVPRDGFHILASRHLPGATYSEARRRVPYNVQIGDFNVDISSVVSRLYPMGIQTVRVNARLQLNASSNYDDLLKRLQSLRKPHNVRAADHLVRQAFALATGDRTIDTTSLAYKTFFGMQITLSIPADQIPAFVLKHQASIVALLIGHRQPLAQSDQIIKRIVKANERINEKSAFEYLLANRGGLIYLTPREGDESPHPDRFTRSLDISELALYANAFLEFSSEERKQCANLVDFLLSKVETWITAPQVVVGLSVTNELLWDVLSEALSLKAALEQWKKSNQTNSGWKSKIELFQRVPKDWWLIQDLPHFLDDLDSNHVITN